MPLFINELKNAGSLPSLFSAMHSGFYTRIYQDKLDPTQLYGALFENMIIIDRLKSRCNAALPVECYFYRDNTGNEVDLIEPEGHHMHAIEIKGGATTSSDYFK